MKPRFHYLEHGQGYLVYIGKEKTERHIGNVFQKYSLWMNNQDSNLYFSRSAAAQALLK